MTLCFEFVSGVEEEEQVLIHRVRGRGGPGRRGLGLCLGREGALASPESNGVIGTTVRQADPHLWTTKA